MSASSLLFAAAGAGVTQYAMDGTFKPLAVAGAIGGLAVGGFAGILAAGAVVSAASKGDTPLAGKSVGAALLFMVVGVFGGAVLGAHFVGGESWRSAAYMAGGAAAGQLVGGMVFKQ